MIEVVKNENYTFDDFLRERAMLNNLANPFLQQVLKDLSESHYPSLLEVLQPFSEKLSGRKIFKPHVKNSHLSEKNFR